MQVMYEHRTGQALKEYREAEPKVTQAQVAAVMGYRQAATVSLIENRARVTELMWRRFRHAVDEAREASQRPAA